MRARRLFGYSQVGHNPLISDEISQPYAGFLCWSFYWYHFALYRVIAVIRKLDNQRKVGHQTQFDEYT